MKLNKLLAASALLVASGVASADPITITNAAGTTSSFTTLGATNLPVTSVYTNNGSINEGSEATDLVGQTLGFSDMGVGTIGQLFPLLGAGPANLEYGNDWTLDFSYNLAGIATFVDGVVDPLLNPVFGQDGSMDGADLAGGIAGNGIIEGFDNILPTYTSGTFEIFFNDLNLLDGDDSQKVLELNLIDFEVAGPSVILTAAVDYSWLAGPNSFVENFFTHKSGFSFFELASGTGGVSGPQELKFRTDFNVDPNKLPTCVDTQCDTLTRDTNINLSGTFAVTEPASLAILGLGLMGLSLRRRKA